jgi:hypothetical protein
LAVWHERLERRFRGIQRFHHAAERCFWKTIDSHRELDTKAHRRFIDRIMKDLRDFVSGLTALAVEENSPSIVAARFQDWLLCVGKPKARLTDIVCEKLEAAFPGSAFQLEFEEVQP